MSAEQPQFFGIYRGVVAGTADPTGKKRLQVRVPQLNGKGVLPWALPCFPFLLQQPKLEATAGPYGVDGKTERITLRLPRTGDPVWVMFENGDPAKPVWVGTWMGV